MKAIKAEEVKEFFRKRDIDFVGIAPVERFIHAPEGRRPTDLLPGAKSVIVIGMHILHAVGRGAKCAPHSWEPRADGKSCVTCGIDRPTLVTPDG